MPSPKPTNKALYNKVKSEAKRRFKKWPSAYASGWLVREYKRRGGRYSSSKGSPKRSSSKSGLSRWFAEKWINVCKLPKKVACGRPKTTLSSWKKNYPYCRPSVRVSPSTPKTSRELSRSEISRRCRTKRRSPMRRVMPKTKRTSSKRKSSKRKSRRRR